MSISRRTTHVVRTLGVTSAAAALALGVAGNAMACTIGELSWVASCNSTDGTATVTVTDTDGGMGTLTLSDSLTPSVDKTMPLNGAKYGVNQVVSFTGVPWKDLSKVEVHVTVPNPESPGHPYLDNVLITNHSISDENCKAPTTPPTTPPTTQPPTTPPSTAPATTPPVTKPTTAPPTTPPVTAPSTSSTVDATATPSPTASGSLATTGGGSGTGMIAGIGAALIVAGAGAVFMLRRRSTGSRT